MFSIASVALNHVESNKLDSISKINALYVILAEIEAKHDPSFALNNSHNIELQSPQPLSHFYY